MLPVDFLKKLDAGLFKAIQFCLGISMIALTSIVVLQVLVRYVFHVSIGGVEELPVYLMLISVWIAAIIVAKDDGHIKIELLDMFIKNKSIIALVNIVLCGLSGIGLGCFGYLSLMYVLRIKGFGDITAGLGIPVWCIMAFMAASCIIMTVYYAVNSVKKIVELKARGAR